MHLRRANEEFLPERSRGARTRARRQLPSPTPLPYS